MNRLGLNFRSYVFLILVSMSWCGSVQADLSREYQLKAAYLLNFARFIYWPEPVISTTESFNICVIGDNPFADSLDRLSDKKIKNKSIKVKYSSEYNPKDNCRIVYISKNKEDVFKEVIKKLNNNTVLTVSDVEGFSQQGGMIGFVRIKNKIKFEINIDQSIKSNIKYRSQLLEVAEQLR